MAKKIRGETKERNVIGREFLRAAWNFVGGTFEQNGSFVLRDCSVDITN